MKKAIVFDFDGVILESMDVKTRAFRELFADYPLHQDKIVQYHLENGGISRFEKFRIIYRDILCLPLPENEFERLSREFSQLVLCHVLHCPFVPGALEFLEKYSLKYDLFVASGTPEEELTGIIRERNLSAFFRQAFGSPRKKGPILKHIMTTYNYAPDEMIFVGDSKSDYSAALEVSVPFVGRVPPGEQNPFPEKGSLTVVHDLNELDRFWRSWVETHPS
jgi:phosphoglycolate phosphatase-like HAD superfamily hydrolase